MDKLLLTAGTALALVTVAPLPGSAADLPVRRAPPPPVTAVPLFTWTGFYAGLNAGATRDDSKLTIRPDAASFRPPSFAPTLALSASDVAFMEDRTHGHDTAFTGGGQLGYNYQIGSFVIGAEADLAVANIRNRGGRSELVPESFGGGLVGALNGLSAQPLSYNTRLQSEVQWFGTVRARAGVAFDRALFYATGGLAYGEVRTDVAAFTTPATYFGGLVDENRGHRSDTRVGWTVGAGVEYALTNAVSLKGEYLYVDLGQKNFNAPAVGGDLAVFPGSIMSASDDSRFHVIRGGVNVRFNSW